MNDYHDKDYMKLFVVMDKMILGKGVFGVFTTQDNALSFMEDFEQKTSNMCEIKEWPLIGFLGKQTHVYAAHTYNDLYDVYTPDGIYIELDDAYEAVGHKGLIIKIEIDIPEGNSIINAAETSRSI
ncbi:MAG TPA: hypothetical protein PLT06_09680 [Syntrophorhabdaceae bacterium]|jgi:hypothetical protein|nr:hypothetical protein [Syntrophorhabdaceae bacterium]HOB69849.1 hypothetical protein [Syntrophorhabdaceae bacterium]HOF58740.1 hypothetical protein [Syntrophorhabdaceae bacterium]HOS06447.1 hypothetical protein [Syntrophorhabdaceae bacterium]HPH41861.1 hypothetical protein [Syntrophorhabdaceae bacterium]